MADGTPAAGEIGIRMMRLLPFSMVLALLFV